MGVNGKQTLSVMGQFERLASHPYGFSRLDDGQLCPRADRPRHEEAGSRLSVALGVAIMRA
jgi:hypothetical protein